MMTPTNCTREDSENFLQETPNKFCEDIIKFLNFYGTFLYLFKNFNREILRI